MEEDMAITEIERFQTRKASKRKARPKRNSELACGFDWVTDSYQTIVWSDFRPYYSKELFAKLGLHCYNFEKAPPHVVIYGGSMPPDSDASNKLVDENWDHDKVIDGFYTCEMLNWLSDEALANDNKKYYVHVADSPPLKINKVVIETKEDYIREASEKLKAENAIFYIIYKYKGVSQSSLDGDHKAIVRKTMDGKPEHMSLEVTNVNDMSDIQKTMHILKFDRKA